MLSAKVHSSKPNSGILFSMNVLVRGSFEDVPGERTRQYNMRFVCQADGSGAKSPKRREG